MACFDQWIAACLVPLAIWLLLSGLDDLFITAVFLLTRRKRFHWPSETELLLVPARRIAILVPLWREDRVIGQMLERNAGGIRYENYDIFVGVYPNDEDTARAVAGAAARHPRVHLATLPHNGPTSKGDCVNWIYRRMAEYEAEHAIRFEVVLTHDAEDMIHPESLRLINWFSRSYEMVQIPVLALPTPPGELTHGLYCDDFAEYQAKDIPVRQRLGGFLPSNGVGTGYDRRALERLAEEKGGRILDPECLTEDYETGFRLHELGFRQIFVPLHHDAAGPVATREYFPRKFRAAVRQRSRWVAGITLQGWQRHGWRAPPRQLYWFWRDRKGLVGGLLSPMANLLFLYGVYGYLAHLATGRPWVLGSLASPWMKLCCDATLTIAVAQMASRCYCSAAIYGWRFAASAPLRSMWGNLLNFGATAGALRQFVTARVRRHTLEWSKTDHEYQRPRLGEVLVRMRWLATEEVEEAVRSQPKGLRLGEHLVRMEKVSEDRLYQALSRQADIPLGLPGFAEINRRATRALPVEAVRRWKVLPYRLEVGQLHMVTPEVPSEEMTRELAAFTALEMRFRLVRPAEFAQMTDLYLP